MSNPPRAQSGSTPQQPSGSPVRRWIIRIILTPLLIVGTLALLLAYKIHAGNKAVDAFPLPAADAPSSRNSILIFSPHPDDETLGTSGLIQQTLAAGGTVHVVFMTNGDAFRVGVSEYYKKVQVAPSDYVRYGEMRQIEAKEALAIAGLSYKDVTFLGYADRGLMGMWERNWLPNNPWQSSYSMATSNPYPNAPSYRKPYCGVNVLADVEQQIVKDHPTDIYVTHPSDDHPDHSASAAFVVAAIHSLEANGLPWVKAVHLHFFLIHRGDWPVPQGFNPSLALSPPAAFVGLDTRWNALQLTPQQTQTKQAALDKYVSQEEMMGRFLVSFVRKNELFADLPEPAEHAQDLEQQTAKLADDGFSWPTVAPVAKDPVADTVLRDFQPAGDISAIYASYDKQNIYLRVSLNAHLSRTVSYHLSIRPFTSDMKTTAQVVACGFTPRSLEEGSPKSYPGGTTVTWRGPEIYYVVPIKALGNARPNLLFVQASTTFARVVVDHTGYRLVYLSPAPIRVPLS